MTGHQESIRLEELTRDQLAAAAPDSVLLLPVGAVEQHGPHLPLGTDTLLARTVAERAAERAAEEGVPVVLAPALPYGHSEHHVFPGAGAASVRADTLAAVLRDLLSSLHRSGFRRFLLVNGHGGNDETIRTVSKTAVLDLPIAVGTVNYWQAGDAAEPAPDGADVPGHAGWWETSLVLAAGPELVRLDRAESELAAPRGLFSYEAVPGLNLQRYGEWERSGGTTDPAAGADGEAGARILAERVTGVAGALRRFHELTAEGTEDSEGTEGATER
jgi:creatinine amidohydrolase